MGTLIAHPENEEKLPYNPDFAEKIERSKEDFKAGNFKAIKTDDLWK